MKANLRELVFDAIAPLVEHIDEKDNVSQIALMTKARRFIQNNLASPDLTPDALGRELALSRTRLYELFETFGGVANIYPPPAHAGGPCHAGPIPPTRGRWRKWER